jgi:predicted dehydrogenase
MKTRRHFLGTSALATGAFLAPRFAIGQSGPSANSRINLAFIGVGGRGWDNLNSLAGENIVALCDIDDQRAAGAFNKFPKAKRFRDYRQMLDKMAADIDAVVVSTPDHSHFPATMAAMELGKHVFTEKPLAHNIWQCRTLKKAARHHKVISQMGNQGHATGGIRYIREWYEAGVLGNVTEVLAWFSGPDFHGPFFRKPDAFPPETMPVPGHIDWDLWRGPHVGEVGYNPVLHPLTWRGFFDFGCAELGDWACHTLDGPFWALQLGMPTVIEAEQREGGSEIFTPDSSLIRFEFPARGDKPPVTLKWHDGRFRPEIRKDWGLEKLDADGMIMVGDKATLMTGGRPDSPKLIPDDVWKDFRRNVPPKTIPRIKGGHYREWTDAIRGDGPLPGSNFDYAAELTEMSLLGVLAMRFGGRVEYDPAAMKVTNRPELNAYLKEPVRDGWRFGENL